MSLRHSKPEYFVKESRFRVSRVFLSDTLVQIQIVSPMSSWEGTKKLRDTVSRPVNRHRQTVLSQRDIAPRLEIIASALVSSPHRSPLTGRGFQCRRGRSNGPKTSPRFLVTRNLVSPAGVITKQRSDRHNGTTAIGSKLTSRDGKIAINATTLRRWFDNRTFPGSQVCLDVIRFPRGPRGLFCDRRLSRAIWKSTLFSFRWLLRCLCASQSFFSFNRTSHFFKNSWNSDILLILERLINGGNVWNKEREREGGERKSLFCFAKCKVSKLYFLNYIIILLYYLLSFYLWNNKIK